MSWFTSLFSSSKNSNSRKAISSTHEAFSLPTSSPNGLPHPDAFNPDALVMSPSSASSSYSYPPASAGGAYDYVPNSAGSRSRQPSILPLHNAPLPPLPLYPPLSHTWTRLRQWLEREYPELGDTLNYGILPQDLIEYEMAFGFQLPKAVRESYLCADGQEPESAAGCSEGLFFGLTLLPLEDVLEEWRFWREVDTDPNTGANEQLREMMQSIPPNWVRKEYSSRGWIPLVADKAGNYLGVDMTPGEEGSVGQVIVFGRDFDTKVVMWKGDGPDGWAKWLANFVDDLESGEGYEIGNTDASEGSEDSVGYGGYFFDGVNGEGGGDGGAGGLKLAGEYKGWNVLEAWADRSVRRWQHAGLVPETIYSMPEKGKKPDVSPQRIAGSGSGAEVPIPVLAEVDEEEESSALATTPLGNVPNQSYTQRQSLPTISVSKPPAPMPVDLPTPDMLEPDSSEVSMNSSEVDLEAGSVGSMMRETNGSYSGVSTASSRAEASTSRSRDITPTGPPLVSLSSPPSRKTPPSKPAIVTEIPDLLADSAPSSQTNIAGTVTKEVDVDVPSAASEESPVMVDHAEALSPTSVDSAVRLVGGGGISGTVDDSLQSDGVLVDEDGTEEIALGVPSSEPSAVASDVGEKVAVAATAAAAPSVAVTEKAEKRSSITSGLKKIGQLGGKRKKNSVSSVKFNE